MTNPSDFKVLVVGGGFGGIAAALRCRALGFQVTLIDRLDNLGGRAQVVEIDGFKHDMGPTVITAPFLFAELFELQNSIIQLSSSQVLRNDIEVAAILDYFVYFH